MEGVDAAIWGNFPARGGTRHGMQIDRVELNQRLEQGCHHVALDGADRCLRIQIRDVAAVADVQNLLAVALLDSRFAARARADRK